MTAPIGVVLMAYGTPGSLDDLESYYTHIRRGRPPTPEQLTELRGRYQAIGGLSPLNARTEAQREAVQRALDERAPGRFVVTLGMKHAQPFIEEAIASLADQRVSGAVGLVLAPHYSRSSVGTYCARAESEAARHQIELRCIESWHRLPALVDFLVDGVRQRLAELPDKTKVFFTAHSLPERVLADDPYPDQLAETAAAVAGRVDLLPWPDWAVAWQSAGRTPEPWRGPDILEVLTALADTGRSEAVLVCPQGFVSDHLEILYDLDIQARERAEERGLAFARTPSVNDDPTVMAALAELVAEQARRAGWS